MLSLLLLMIFSLGGCAAVQTTKFNQDIKAGEAALLASKEQCTRELATPELDPIKHKVELFRDLNDGPPPFEIASNDTFPTDSERTVIAKWAALRDTCSKRSNALLVVPSSATAMQAAVLQQRVAFYRDSAGHVAELVVSLYQQKLTYGEFAQRRYWITSQAAAAELAYRQSVIERDQQRQLQAQQQFANTLAAWGTYIQAVNARQPQTVYINGTIRVQ
jgi:hypothetical protein